jgi:hypothetical protein
MTSEDDVEIFRGDSYDLPFTITNKITGAIISLAGATLKMTVTTIKDPPDDTFKLFDMDGVINADPTTGKVAFRPTVQNTAAIGKYFYDIQLSGADGSVRKVQKAKLDIVQDNTK